jgi:glycosyltransferase involved in cell wall biosynthesis
LGTPDGRGGITWKSRLEIAFSRYAARRANAIVCKSEELRAALPRGDDRARAHVIPNGVNVHQFAPGDRLEARRRLGLDPQETLVLFPHTPGVSRKRQDLAEAGVGALAPRGVRARLWMVHGVPHALMPDHYRAADCLLLTSDQEGSPNVVKEALCCDLPVVSVNVGDVRVWVELGVGSQIVDRDPDAIAAGLQTVLRGDRRADGARVRAAVAADRIARQLIAVYADAMHHRDVGLAGVSVRREQR